MRKSITMRISIQLTDEMQAMLTALEQSYRHAPRATLGRIALTRGLQLMVDEARSEGQPDASAEVA